MRVAHQIPACRPMRGKARTTMRPRLVLAAVSLLIGWISAACSSADGGSSLTDVGVEPTVRPQPIFIPNGHGAVTTVFLSSGNHSGQGQRYRTHRSLSTAALLSRLGNDGTVALQFLLPRCYPNDRWTRASLTGIARVTREGTFFNYTDRSTGVAVERALMMRDVLGQGLFNAHEQAIKGGANISEPYDVPIAVVGFRSSKTATCNLYMNHKGLIVTGAYN